MKKFLAILLALTMVLGMSVMVSADEPTVYGDMKIVTLKKSLTSQGVNPAETFNFTVGDGVVKEGSATSAPTIGNFSINVAQGATEGTTSINLPSFTQVGKYEYDIQEIAGNTAGMVYDTVERTLVVQVFYQGEDLVRVAYLKYKDGEKIEDFVVANNDYKSGDLEVDKTFSGNFVDTNDEFTITVTLEVQEGKTFNPAAMTADSAEETTITLVDGKVTLTYKVKQSGLNNFTINNIPYDVDYSVVETGFDGFNPVYTVSYDTNKAGEIKATSVKTVVNNHRNQGIETGISLDNLPYIMTMILALGGLVLFVVRKRRFN